MKKRFIAFILMSIFFLSAVIINPVTAYNDFYSENDILFYDENADGVICPPQGGGPDFDTGEEPVIDGSVWNSGLSGPYIVEQYAIEVLKSIAAKKGIDPSNTVTYEHVLALVTFAMGEGGDTANVWLFNLYNSGLNAPELIEGEHAGDGTQSYKSFDAGVEATSRHMVKKIQSRTGYILSQKYSTAEDFFTALTYYDRYDGNSLWAEASVNNPEQYLNFYKGVINTVRKDYAKYASIVIGTSALEKIDGIRNESLLQFNPISEDGDVNLQIASENNCYGSGGLLVSGGMVAVDQVKEFLNTYRSLTDTEISQYLPNAYTGCSGGVLANCVAFSQYFINRYTTINYAHPRNGRYVVDSLAEIGFPTGTTPRVYSVFSTASSEAGHTGVIVGIDNENNKIYVAQMGCGYELSYEFGIEYELSKFTNGDYVFAYTDGFLKGGL